MNYTFKKFTPDYTPVWTEINNQSSNSTFLTDLNWIEFQKRVGRDVEQFLIYQNDNAIGIFSIEIWRRRFSKYAYLPRGPVFLNSLNGQEKTILFKELKKFGQEFCKNNNLNLLRIDPLIDISFQKDLKIAGWKESLALGQVKNTWLMNIEKDAKELLKDQKKDTRYYIKRAQKKGVEIIKAKGQEHLKEFNKLMNETKERNMFGGFNDEYYSTQWNSLNVLGNSKIEGLEKSLCEIYLAKYEEKYISGALINYHGDLAHYAHGASTSNRELSNLASPYLLLWTSIIDAKEKGYKTFDFWGVIPKGVKHEWRGLSDFKMKFNGEFKQYTGTFEVYPNLIKYYFNRLVDWYTYRKLRY